MRRINAKKAWRAIGGGQPKKSRELFKWMWYIVVEEQIEALVHRGSVLARAQRSTNLRIINRQQYSRITSGGASEEA